MEAVGLAGTAVVVVIRLLQPILSYLEKLIMQSLLGLEVMVRALLMETAALEEQAAFSEKTLPEAIKRMEALAAVEELLAAAPQELAAAMEAMVQMEQMNTQEWAAEDKEGQLKNLVFQVARCTLVAEEAAVTLVGLLEQAVEEPEKREDAEAHRDK